MNPECADHLARLYGPDRVGALASRLEALLTARAPAIPVSLRGGNRRTFTEQDNLLITYADQFVSHGEPPLQALASVLNRHLRGWIRGVHLLPFYPWSSDDGFAVKDYLSVDPACGTWDDIQRLSDGFELMFDAVFNHLSAQGEWFRRFLAGDPAFHDFFVTVTGQPDLSAVVRPRALPLLTDFTGPQGSLRVWTTFSADQVDLNLHNPEVLFALIEVLLHYVARGARWIRLDAIAFLWKEPGTPCLHLPQTHRIIQLMRAVLDRLAPGVVLITETNVPHRDNLSYFGDGQNEAQLVYNFALPPLIVHTFRTGDASALQAWAASLPAPSNRATFLNFLASHDGIGLNPVRGILTSEQIGDLVSGTLARGGLVSRKHNPDGSTSPYEMNINFLDSLAEPEGSGEPDSARARRHLTAHAIMLALPGVPGIYIHSLLGSRGDRAAADATGMPRRINRARLCPSELHQQLANPSSLRCQVFQGFRELLRCRAAHPAFSPASNFRVMPSDPGLMVIQRESADGQTVLCLHNITAKPVALPVDSGTPHPLLSLGGSVGHGSVRLEPHGTLWMT